MTRFTDPADPDRTRTYARPSIQRAARGRPRVATGGRPGPIWRVPLAVGAALAALVLVGCGPLFPDVEDWIADSEKLRQRFDARLGDLQQCLAEDDCGEVLDSEESVFAMCSWVGSRGERAPDGFEAAEWPRFDGLCEGLEGVLAVPRADALERIAELRLETDRISEGIRDDIEPWEREEADRDEGQGRGGERGATTAAHAPRAGATTRSPHARAGG